MAKQIEIPFDAVTEAVSDQTGMVCGCTTFYGIPYTFERGSGQNSTLDSLGKWFVLSPADKINGVPLRALGSFVDDTRVRGTEVGTSLLDDQSQHRKQFARFLLQIKNGTATYVHWVAFIIEFFSDPVLEAVRLESYELFLDRGLHAVELGSSQWVRLDQMLSQLHNADK